RKEHDAGGIAVAEADLDGHGRGLAHPASFEGGMDSRLHGSNSPRGVHHQTKPTRFERAYHVFAAKREPVFEGN
ncbi:MAG TPA: hypothetical protein VLJ62_10920, partial [Burkholderiaceae bacterium]|nr:hypothetical protein [Burkholderiaceae bacterium]